MKEVIPVILLLIGIANCVSTSESVNFKAFLHAGDVIKEPCSLEKVELIDNQKTHFLSLWETKKEIFAPHVQVILDNEPTRDLDLNGSCSYQMKADAENSNFRVEIVTFNNELRGSITHGEVVYDIAPQSVITGRSPLSLKIHKRKPRGTCGVTGHHNHTAYGSHQTLLTRSKRSATVHVENPNTQNYYLELFLVIDNRAYTAINTAKQTAENYAIEVINNVNAYYREFSVHIVLVGLEIWSSTQKVDFPTDSDEALNLFALYRREKINIKHDNAQALTSTTFANTYIGKAYMDGMCQYSISAGITTIHTSESALDTSSTVAHEMGHNFGLEHDESPCSCAPDTNCMMGTGASDKVIVKWSDCSIKALNAKLKTGLSWCLMDDPTGTKVDSAYPICGNGIVDDGEDCDLGLRSTSTKCCNPATCKFTSGSECASGLCCNTETCTKKSKGTQCSYMDSSSPDVECDFAEYCNGKSEFCPQDTFPADGVKQCAGNQGDYCFKKRCGSRANSCKMIFGSDAVVSPDICYRENAVDKDVAQVESGFCSYSVTSQDKDIINYAYQACSASNYQCGSTHCQSSSKTTYTAETISWPGITNIHSLDNNGVPCYHTRIDLTKTDLRDPSLAMNGAKCGTDMVCLNAACVSVDSLVSFDCKNAKCENGGICNNFGGCHCPSGFSGATCAVACPNCCGGSEQANYCDTTIDNNLVVIICSVVAAIAVLAIIIIVAVVMFQKGMCSKKPSSVRTTMGNSSNQRQPPISTISGNTQLQGYSNKGFASSNPNLYTMSPTTASAKPRPASSSTARYPSNRPSGPVSPNSRGAQNYAYSDRV